MNAVEGKGRMNGLTKGIERIRGNDNRSDNARKLCTKYSLLLHLDLQDLHVHVHYGGSIINTA